MNKKILILEFKLMVLVGFALILSCLLAFFDTNAMVMIIIDLLIFFFSWVVIKTQVVNPAIRTIKELRELSLTKDKFFDVIAHDLRSPSNGIQGFASLLLEQPEDFTEEEKTVFLQNILLCSINSNKLLDSLSEWARLQTGRLRPNPQPFDVDKMIESVVAFHQGYAVQRKITLLSNVKESFVAACDENMIETALRNLVSNAIKFTQVGGSVEINFQKSEKEVIISIKDTGKGMSPMIKNNLFKLGENIITPDISGKRGTGLGLILSKELIEKNGGRLWVESELGKGSTFYFTVTLS
ncbi:MAG: HAMP domain-containing sensor histidine kinase [bacterium]